MMKQKVVATLVILVFGFLSLSAQNRQWLWANDGGSTSSDDNGYGIARDNYGNIFVTGTFRSPGVVWQQYPDGPAILRGRSSGG
ncbi:MAG TPA: SBBP repeat-containing protein [Candidatus Cloacimonadota bacterium]|nr:SBBP repeat-containing protein [Candidatus Cloacimonadota bacterium]